MDRLTLAQAAAVVGVSVDTLRRAARRGEIPADRERDARNLPVWYVRMPDVEQWVATYYKPKMGREHVKHGGNKPGPR